MVFYLLPVSMEENRKMDLTGENGGAMVVLRLGFAGEKRKNGFG